MRSVTLIFLLFGLFLAGCSDKSRPESAQIWLEHGDPQTLLSNTLLDGRFTVLELMALKGAWVQVDIRIARRSTLKELQDQYTAQDPNKRKPVLRWHSPIQIEQDRIGRLHLLDKAMGLDLAFEVSTQGGLNLVQHNGIPSELLHVSRHKDYPMVSLLISGIEDRNLNVIYISREPSRVFPLNRGQNRFPWIFQEEGRWQRQSLEIGFCGFPSQFHLQLGIQAVADWQKVLENRLKLKPKVFTKDFPPFSDLNHHCIYWVDNFVREASNSMIKGGQTHPLLGPHGTGFIDADVFVFAQELRKVEAINGRVMPESETNRLVKTILTHEIGHILGLDHPSEKGAQSIMAEGNISEIQPVDVEALRALYSLETKK